MKKKVIGVITCLLLCTILGAILWIYKGKEALSAKETKIIMGAQFVTIDASITQDTDKMGFQIPFIYKGKVEEENGLGIELVDVKGKSIDKSMVSVEDETFENCKDMKIDGYQWGFIGVIIDYGLEIDHVSIEEMTLKILGETQVIAFENTIQWNRVNNDYKDMLSVTYPSVILSDAEYEFPYYITSYKPLIITKCYFKNMLETTNVEFKVNEKTVDFDSNTGISVQNEDHIEVTVFGKNEEHNRYNSGIINLVVEYKDENGVKKEYTFISGKQGLSNEEDVEVIMKLLLEGENQ